MLVTMKHVLEIAEEKKIAIGSFNTPLLECVEAVIGAAEELDLPVIIQLAEGQQRLTPLNVIGPVMVELAKRASVPVCVHLDHGNTLECVDKCLDLGFTSVMYDGSTLPYAENLENTKKARMLSYRTGASLEAELGSMGKRESGTGEAGGDDTKIYTDPDQAAEFVRETKVDALACSFGTTHGIYLTEPKLDFDVVRKVREKTGGIPVVMHGGSGVSREDYHNAVKAGVRKINYFTYMDKAGGAAAVETVKNAAENEPMFFSTVSMAARDAMKENARAAMRMFALRD